MNQRNKTGLFFGSFDPIHVGHLIIAEFIYNQTDLDKVWFVLSPQNPHKTDHQLTNTTERLQMLKMAIEDNPLFEVCDIELGLTTPNFTFDTLTVLKEKYPGKKFVLMVGSDNILTLERWKNYQRILEMVDFYVYPRGDFNDHKLFGHNAVKLIAAPRVEISSTGIRESIANNLSVRYFLHHRVFDYISLKGLYKV